LFDFSSRKISVIKISYRETKESRLFPAGIIANDYLILLQKYNNIEVFALNNDY